MRRTGPGIVLALLLAGSAAPLPAQLGFVLGGGPTVPLSDYKEFAQTGWMAMGGLALSFPLLPIQLRAEGLFGVNAHEGASKDKTVLYGGIANVIYQIAIPLSPIKPYFIGGVGALNHHFSPGDSGFPSDDEWKFMFGVGGGIQLGLGGVGVFAEARYVKRDDTVFVPVMGGVRIGG